MELLHSYGYPLAEANAVLATHKNEVTVYSKRVLAQLERGETHSWEQLIAQDHAFIQAHS